MTIIFILYSHGTIIYRNLPPLRPNLQDDEILLLGVRRFRGIEMVVTTLFNLSNDDNIKVD